MGATCCGCAVGGRRHYCPQRAMPRLPKAFLPSKRRVEDVTEDSAAALPLFGRKRSRHLPVARGAENERLVADASGEIVKVDDGMPCQGLEEYVEMSVNAALTIHAGVWESFQESLRLHKEVRARDLAEQQVAGIYGELCDIVATLIGCVDGEESTEETEDRRCYDVVRFQGRDVVSANGGRKRATKRQIDMSKQLVLARSHGISGRTRDALVAALAVLSTRREMSWLDAYDMEWPVRGYFAHALVDPTSVCRVSLVRDGGSLRPASLVATHTLPLAEALWRMDGCGPLAGESRTWCQKGGREFALQEIIEANSGEEEHRQPAHTLRPEPMIRELLCTNKPIVLLDAYVALAPREHSRKHRLSEIVRAELVALLREAKAQGHAVVFQVGGDDPHLLAEKVYLQPAFTQYGLRCGYLRWRGSPRTPWAREQSWNIRACLGLQLP